MLEASEVAGEALEQRPMGKCVTFQIGSERVHYLQQQFPIVHWVVLVDKPVETTSAEILLHGAKGGRKKVQDLLDGTRPIDLRLHENQPLLIWTTNGDRKCDQTHLPNHPNLKSAHRRHLLLLRQLLQQDHGSICRREQFLMLTQQRLLPLLTQKQVLLAPLAQ